MKILTITNMFPSRNYPYNGIFIRDHVDSLRAKGVDVDVFFTNPKITRTTYFTRIPDLSKVIRSGNYDILHVHHSYCIFQMQLIRIKLRSIPPTVFTIHEGEAFAGKSRDSGYSLSLSQFSYSRKLKLLALKMADHVISVEKRLPKVIGFKGDFEVIPPGIDISKFKPMKLEKCRAKLGFDIKDTIIFFPADAERSGKGFDIFMKSVNILGDGLRVITGGSILPEMMPYYLNAADVVVQTSAFEASPMILKEAMACNRPIVSSDVGDAKELFGETIGCFITTLDPSDIAGKLRFALNRHKTFGRNRVVELGLSLEETALKYIRTFLSILSSEEL